MSYDKTIQLLVIGDSSVGKTSLITRYTNGTFKEEYLATVGLDYYSKVEAINNQTINIKLWDTAGQERYKALTQNYFRNAEGVLLTFDVTNTDSFNNLKDWIGSIKTNMESKNIFLPLIIVGNKIDMEDAREINKEDAEKFVSDNNYKYFETSAKTGEGVDDAIRDLVNQVLEQGDQLDDHKIEARKSVQLKDAKVESAEVKKKGCC
jgi:small GTP-binding protein